MSKKKSYVFISYSGNESEAARKIKDILVENGIECWMAPDSIDAGERYNEVLPPAVRNCAAFILMLSDEAQKSKYVSSELSIAFDSDRIILPFMFKECEIGDKFIVYIKEYQTLKPSSFNSVEDMTAELVRRAQSLVMDSEISASEPSEDSAKDESHGKHLAEIIKLYNEALKYTSTNTEKAERAFLDTIKCANKSRRTLSTTIDCYIKLAHLYTVRNSCDDAEQCLLKCIDVCNELRYHKPEFYDSQKAEAYRMLGNVYVKTASINKAIVNYNLALNIYTSLNDTTKYAYKMAEVHGALGKIYADYGVYGDAGEQYGLGIKLFERLVNIKSEKYGLDLSLAKCRLAEMYCKKGDKLSAIETYKQAISVLKELMTSNGDDGYMPYIDNINKSIERIKGEI